MGVARHQAVEHGRIARQGAGQVPAAGGRALLFGPLGVDALLQGEGADHDVEILNPELVICNLTKDTALNMRLKIERGFGYQPAAARRRPDEETRAIGRLVLDASFSPVRRVSYAVENARVEQRTDLDKLVMEIETNGAINAEDAVRQSADRAGRDPMAIAPCFVQVCLIGEDEDALERIGRVAPYLRPDQPFCLTYGDGLAERVRAVAPQGVDAVLDASGRGEIPLSIELTGNPARVLTLVAFDAAGTGIQIHAGGSGSELGAALGELAALAAQARLVVSISQTFPLTEAAAALSASMTGHGHGKIAVVP